MESCLNALNAGGVVLFPTDTVYGLLARADKPEAVEKIYQIKKRERSKPLIRLIQQLDPADPDLRGLNERPLNFLRSLWPGPLTAVGLTGQSLRWANHDELNALIGRCEGPIVSTSANLSGEKEAVTLSQVSPEIRSQVDAVFEGECHQGSASTVVKIDNNQFEILRPGPLDEKTLRYFWCTRIAFVCTGNTCRSPMAEAYAKIRLKEKLQTDDLTSHNLWVESAGVYAAQGALASDASIEVMQNNQIDLKAHRSQAITHLIHYPPKYLYGLTRNHVTLLRELGLKAELLDLSGQDVSDPFGGSMEGYQRAFEFIKKSIDERLNDWIQEINLSA